MPYTARFIATDNLLIHLSTMIGTISDPAIQADYAGFLSVSGVTVFELAIKDIFIEFALKKNKVFGTFIDSHFEKINGRIKLDDLKKSHIKQFGEKYLKKFNKKLQEEEKRFFSTSSISIISDYGNLITCRHDYVHKGSPTLTIGEVIRSYQNGKEVIHCLNFAMKR